MAPVSNVRGSRTDRLVGMAAASSDTEPVLARATANVSPGGAGAGTSCCCGGVLTPNAKVLLVAMALFGIITALQVFAALASNSAALMADCVSMGIDALSYGANAISEVWPHANQRKQQRNQLATAGISIVLLAYFTTFFLLESVSTITSAGDKDHSCCDIAHENSDCWAATNSVCANVSRSSTDAGMAGPSSSVSYCVYLIISPVLSTMH